MPLGFNRHGRELPEAFGELPEAFGELPEAFGELPEEDEFRQASFR